MKFGLCGNMVVTDLMYGGMEIAPMLAELGYDYIELSLAHLTELTTPDFQSLKNKLYLSGIPCESCNNFFPPGIKLTGPEANLPEILSYARKAIKCATELGASVVVFGSGPSKNVPHGFPKDLAWEQLVWLCREIDPVAEAHNIIVVLEPLRKEECNIVNSVAEALKLMRDSNVTNTKVLADYYHMFEEMESPDVLLEAALNIKHVHFANPAGRIFPKSLKENQGYIPFFENLKKIGYSERISIEAFSDNLYEDAKGAIKFLNQINKL